jgi:hypothetical protein
MKKLKENMKMEIRSRPCAAIAKLIRVIESCETKDQLQGMANRMWWNFLSKYPGYDYGPIGKPYNDKLEELNELENELEEGGICD